jgi:DNA-binding transcriptional MerR regulator/effector-binding domain-containing protein
VSERGLLRIGPFARASSLSVKALRSYHEIGLLVPAEVDPVTGYRSYSAAQLTDAAVVRRLRQLDVPLDAIRQVLDARDPAVTKKVLLDHGAVLDQRLAALQHAVDDLYRAVEVPAWHTPIHRRHEPALTVLGITGSVTEAGFDAFLDRTQQLLHEAAASTGAVITGPFGGCYPPMIDDDVQDVVAFVPVAAAPLLSAAWQSAGIRVAELPATPVAVLAHRGSYDTLPDSYQELGAWVAANDEPSDLPVRELYLVSTRDTDDPDELRTEICWPITDAAP